MIGERLTAQGIPTPSEMKRARGEDLGRRSSAAWSKGTIRKILQNPVYLGHMVQGKEEKISFKEKKTRELPRNQWIVVEHTHEAIIKEEIFGGKTAITTKVRTAPLPDNKIRTTFFI